jgi:hypothetical protein
MLADNCGKAVHDEYPVVFEQVSKETKLAKFTMANRKIGNFSQRKRLDQLDPLNVQ